MNLRKQLAIWAVRLLLTALFIFASEILLWTDIVERSLLEWLLRIVGYTALSTFILDMAVRYRLRDIYDFMALFAMYGLLAALLITPHISFQNFPISLLTRVLGGHTVLGFELFGLLLVLTAGDKARYRLVMLAFAGWLGFFWGVWTRWIPVFGTLFPVVNLQTMFTYAGIVIVIAAVLYGLVVRTGTQLKPFDFRLSLVEWLVLLVVFLLLFVLQATRAIFTSPILLAVGALLVVSWAILWFRRDEHAPTILDCHFPLTPLSSLWIVLALLVFFAATILGFFLPLAGNEQLNQLWLMEMYFGAAGAIWLPLIAGVIAVRGIDYQMRTRQIV